MKNFKDILASSGSEVSIIPVIPGDGFMKIDESELPESLPILALRNAVLFPGAEDPITKAREKSARLVEDPRTTTSSAPSRRTTLPLRTLKKKTCMISVR